MEDRAFFLLPTTLLQAPFSCSCSSAFEHCWEHVVLCYFMVRKSVGHSLKASILLFRVQVIKYLEILLSLSRGFYRRY